GDDDRGLRLEAAHAAFDIKELFYPEVGAEARFGDDDVGEGERRPGGENAVAAVGDVAKRSGVDERRPALERLDEVRPERILEEERHCAGSAQLARRDRPPRRAG